MLRHVAAFVHMGIVTVTIMLSCRPASAGPAAAIVEVNGVQFALAQHALNADAERAARVLEARWRRETPAAWVGFERVGSRYIVARRRGAIHETATFRPGLQGAGSFLLVSVLDTVAAPRPIPRPPTDLPPGSLWLSSTRTFSVQPEVTVEWLAVTDRPIMAARPLWLLALRRSGWVERGPPDGPARIFERDGHTVAIHWEANGAQTAVVLQWRKGEGR